ncbi:hypothetical protein, variant [Verruconis gallopava]|uniref:Uncharacterized protein n=1 Tax=Verruconis gallopava TaxID=253628 RepID=A0A0D1XCD0_9PEZI|nr:hypothetical protein, variant [Verruconis gallopava]KIV99940.1 hypothetical protein, variant [Verruconis gallopava]
MKSESDDSLVRATSHMVINDDGRKSTEISAATTDSKADAMDFPKPTSSVLGDKRVWDITAKFRHVASTLPVGTLVKDTAFTLFESVGALEIMDPKMDSGCLAPGESLVDEYDLERPLLPEEVIGIIDQFLCCEMAWYEGYPLAQTLFSSHYIDKLLSLEAKNVDQIHFSKSGRDNVWSSPLVHLVLRAYCIAMIKCCDYALEEINRSLDGGGTRCNFYEEEDFSGHTYGRELFTKIPLKPILDLLSLAAEFTSTEKEHSVNGQHLGSPDLYGAIAARINFRITLLRAMSLEEDIEDKFKLWKDMPGFLADIKTTHSLGLPVKESFSPKIQRRLASTVPPKPMVEISFDDALTKLENMCKDCAEAVKIVHFGPHNVQPLKSFLWAFSSRKPEPYTYPRACLAAALFMCDDSGFQQLLRRDLEDIVLAGSDVLDPINWTIEAPQSKTPVSNRRFEMAKAVSHFCEVAVHMPGGYIDYFRTLTSNRCRVRRNLTHVAAALEDLQTMETEHLDESLRKFSTDEIEFPLSSWTYLQKLRVMEWIVQLGFELDMYLPDELAGMYCRSGSTSCESEGFVAR